VFFSEKSKCSTCHRVNEEGGKIGPDLSTIGANRSSSDLLESIVFPSATLVRDYPSYTLLTAEGQTLTGLIVRDTGDEVFVQQQLGEPVRIARKDIEELLPSTVSLMPNGLDQALTEAELADVVAYLQSLKAKEENPLSAKRE
jgi:putative heme-binding domain-containing protein